jgi:hypothetical protein
VVSKLSLICWSASRIRSVSSRIAASRSLRCASSSSARSSASRYSSAASGLTGPTSSKLLATAGEPLHPREQRVAIGLAQGVLPGQRLEAEASGQSLQLELGLGRLIAGLLGLDLGCRHAVAALTQARLQYSLLAGALAQLARERRAGGTVRHQLLLECGESLLERADDKIERRPETLELRQQARVDLGPSREHRATTLAEQTLMLEPLGGAALGGQFAIELSAAHGEVAGIGRNSTLLDQPGGETLALQRLGVFALGRPQQAVGVLAPIERLLFGQGCGGGGGERALFGLCHELRLGDQRVAAVALLERTLASPAWRLRQLAE